MNIKEYTLEGQKFIEISNSDSFVCTFCNLGAAIYEIDFDNEVMTLTPSTPKENLCPGYISGRTVGRVASRLSSPNLNIDGRFYKLVTNQDGLFEIHSGKEGWQNHYWPYQIFDRGDEIEVKFTRLSPDGESNFPGNVFVEISYFVYECKNELRLEFHAKSDAKTALSFTNHVQFGLGKTSCYDLEFKMNSKHRDIISPITCALDELVEIPVEEQYLDFRKIDSNFDSFYQFDGEHLIELRSDKCLLQVRSSYPGAVLWSQFQYVDINYKGGNDREGGSLAIEPQINLPKGCIIDANEDIYHWNTYTFKRI